MIGGGKFPIAFQKNKKSHIHYHNSPVYLPTHNFIPFFFPPQTNAGGDPQLGQKLRQTDAESERAEGVPGVSALRVQRGKHPLLAGLRGAQEGNQPRGDRGEG